MANNDNVEKVDLRRVPEAERPEMPDYVKAQIYKITCTTNNKVYVGQTRSHIMNHSKYRPFGYIKRWKQHISESKGNYRKQSSTLNDCIKANKEEDFLVELLEECNITDSHDREKHYINEYKTFETETGLNLTPGGRAGGVGEAQRKKISDTLKGYFASDENLKELSKSHTNIYDNNRIFMIKAHKEIRVIKVSKFTSEVRFKVTTEADNPYETKFATSKQVTIDDIMVRVEAIINAVKQDSTQVIYK